MESISSPELAAAAAAAAALSRVAGFPSSPDPGAGDPGKVCACGLCVKFRSQIGELLPYTSSSNMDRNLWKEESAEGKHAGWYIDVVMLQRTREIAVTSGNG